MRAWIERWGFAVLVGSAVALGFVVGATVTVPADIPAIALQAAPVYRLEVGAALFAGLYVVSMAFVPALRNRGFSEIGTSGVRAHDLGRVSDVLAAERHALAELAALMAKPEKGAGDSGD